MRVSSAAAGAALASLAAVIGGAVWAKAADGESFAIVGDAIPSPHDGRVGDAGRGRQIVLDRRRGNCLICHQVPVQNEPFQGELGPDLAGIGNRLTAGQMRLRLVDQSRLNPQTLMPPYHRTHGLRRVPADQEGRPVLEAGEIEDIVAWLATLK